MIFSYIRRLGPFFLGGGGGVQNFEFQYIFGGFRKMIIFGGYEEYFWGVLEIPNIFWRGERYMRGPSLRMKNKSEYPSGVSVRCYVD